MSMLSKLTSKSQPQRCTARTGRNGKFCGKVLRQRDGRYCSNYKCQLFASC
ncbi:hypothetical protein [Lentzea sp. NPDC003310]|uniref:hypothetical protein n=1 Tax=Lentzea sp. NPDC003310 TaxID=3154447 RepID=UPI0033AA32E1